MTGADSPPTAHPRLRVLLVEDNLINQRVAQLMLANLGHEVDTVVNGREAVDRVRHTSYDVVLMDVDMPVMDGLEATRLIVAHFTHIQRPAIVALTASADRSTCLAAGMDRYLAKPVRMKVLSAMLDEVMALPD